ncbi:hypothetical protein [Paraglaciecola arctica]|uniref:hypothetical protein n=1 Tax=Paraglaciecola arctica TaxID=1128911 RepID=UPI001C075E3A|nr:hypothetical protein [Paraglaciecola arctica]MBU3003312.1 hypothetical protein [Paraglaciecola arctica]
MQYFISVFVSAFLVFQIQPIISKTILPWFGGGASVWTTCMLFFQFFLLVGYIYAYVLTKTLRIKTQVVVHLILLALGVIFLPFGIHDIHNIEVAATPTWGVLTVLFISLGFPYLMLSANTPLLQHWFSSDVNNVNPYRLYAISNVGSFLALISYPIVFEPFMSLDGQLELWSSIYCVFVALVVWIFYVVVIKSQSQKLNNAKQLVNSKVGFSQVTLWFLLAALGVVLLVSTTNALTQNVPPVPFLWIVPLAIYLLTYVMAFSSLRLYLRVIWIPCFMVLSFVALLIYIIGGQFDFVTQLIIYLLILLCGCMICHGELNALKPRQGNTTLFYLFLSAGGVFGSFLVTFVAKELFDEFLEFPLAIVSVLLVVAASLWWVRKDEITQLNKGHIAAVNQLFLLSIGSLVVALVWLLVFINLNSQYQQYDVAKDRNFYGILSVKDINEGKVKERRLVDGTTSHGSQSLPLTPSPVPLSYYRPGTGGQLIIDELSNVKNLQVGVIGLGVGALAAYGRPGDLYTFYELNPLVSVYANRYFKYLENAQADVEVKLGDARVTLQNELDSGQRNNFDLLIIDAFSGDLIPTHLMTHEAFMLYQQHIKTSGVIALHISNRHLSLLPVIAHHSRSLKMQMMLFDTPGGGYEHDAQWVVLTNNRQLTESPRLMDKQTPIISSQYQSVVWTDDYSSLLPILKVLN